MYLSGTGINYQMSYEAAHRLSISVDKRDEITPAGADLSHISNIKNE